MKKLNELTEVEKQRLVNFYDYLTGDDMDKEMIFYKLFEIVRWDYEEGADMKYPIPFEGKDVGAYVRSLLSQAESHLTTHETDGAKCPECSGALNKCSSCGVVVTDNLPRRLC